MNERTQLTPNLVLAAIAAYAVSDGASVAMYAHQRENRLTGRAEDVEDAYMQTALGIIGECAVSVSHIRCTWTGKQPDIIVVAHHLTHPYVQARNWLVGTELIHGETLEMLAIGAYEALALAD